LSNKKDLWREILRLLHRLHRVPPDDEEEGKRLIAEILILIQLYDSAE
jgi:hypothetical protein